MKGNQMEADICRFVEKNLSALAEQWKISYYLLIKRKW